MNDQSFLLSFEFDSKSETLEIHVNTQGLEKLIFALTHLLQASGNDHVHLMTSNWGGGELSSEEQYELNILINHVKVFKWE